MLRRLISVAAVLIVGWSALGQALADRIPADAQIYIGWAGSDGLMPAYAKSHLKAVLDHSTLPLAIEEFLPALAKRLATDEPDAAQIVAVISSVGGPLWHRPCALYFGGADFPAGGPPTPRLALVCDGGDKAV